MSTLEIAISTRAPERALLLAPPLGLGLLDGLGLGVGLG